MREDGEDKHLSRLIGPKLYEANWRDLTMVCNQTNVLLSLTHILYCLFPRSSEYCNSNIRCEFPQQFPLESVVFWSSEVILIGSAVWGRETARMCVRTGATACVCLPRAAGWVFGPSEGGGGLVPNDVGVLRGVFESLRPRRPCRTSLCAVFGRDSCVFV